MGIAQSFERRLEQFVEGFFARTFKSGLQPVELGRKLGREMDRGKTVTGKGIVVANHYLVALSTEDTERFSHFRDALRSELIAGLTEECQRQGWRTLGAVDVEFSTDPSLKLGRYVIESRIIEGAVAPESLVAPAAPSSSPAAAPPAAPERAAVPSNPRIEAANGQRFPLRTSPLQLGRLDDCEIRFDDPNVSRHHAIIEPGAGGWSIRDLGSTNGTYVNGVRIAAPTSIGPGDTITVGRNELTYRS